MRLAKPSSSEIPQRLPRPSLPGRNLQRPRNLTLRDWGELPAVEYGSPFCFRGVAPASVARSIAAGSWLSPPVARQTPASARSRRRAVCS